MQKAGFEPSGCLENRRIPCITCLTLLSTGNPAFACETYDYCSGSDCLGQRLAAFLPRFFSAHLRPICHSVYLYFNFFSLMIYFIVFSLILSDGDKCYFLIMIPENFCFFPNSEAMGSPALDYWSGFRSGAGSGGLRSGFRSGFRSGLRSRFWSRFRSGFRSRFRSGFRSGFRSRFRSGFRRPKTFESTLQ